MFILVGAIVTLIAMLPFFILQGTKTLHGMEDNLKKIILVFLQFTWKLLGGLERLLCIMARAMRSESIFNRVSVL